MVYQATTKSLIEGVISGYNATVFAYGPTGEEEAQRYARTAPPFLSPRGTKPFILHQRTSLARGWSGIEGMIQILPHPEPFSPRDPIPQPSGREQPQGWLRVARTFPNKGNVHSWPLPCSPPVCPAQAAGRPTPCWALTTSQASMFGPSMTCSEPSRRPAMTWNMRCPCHT